MGVLEQFERWARKDMVGSIFPREVGIPRKTIADEVDFIEYVSECGGVDCYASVFANWQVRQRKFDTIFLDIDNHNGKGLREIIEISYDKLQSVLRQLQEYVLRVYFTGRGFHVYCDFPMTRLELYGDVVREWAKTYEILGYVDNKVVGDVRRIARIPETINRKIGLTMIAIDLNWGVDEIIRSAKEGRSADYDVEINYGLEGELKQLEESIREKYEKGGVKRKLEVSDDVKKYFMQNSQVRDLPDCIRRGVETLIETGELEHYWRVAITIFLLKVWGFKKTKELFEMFAGDYRECTTKYQLRFIQSKGYKCYSCYKLKLMGICQYDKQDECPFYVLSNGWLENMVGDWE